MSLASDSSRYIIGIDLGTTNSAVAYVDCSLERNPGLFTQSLDIPQLLDLGRVERLKTLPSFCYLAREGEFPKGALNLPWGSSALRRLAPLVLGAMARDSGSLVPTQVIQSAKSWLCNAAASRRDPILPVQARDPSDRMSPVESTAAYLRHLREAWNFVIAKGDPERDFAEQDIVLTVPASFDEVARTLTVEAAKLAGYEKLTLLEEPQAAFYSWIQEQGDGWQQQLAMGASVLVCDVGGGTSDFSLITKVDGGFQRMSVGRHLLLGGDNMDASLCYWMAKKLDRDLDARQQLELLRHARAAKEQLIDAPADASYRVTIQGQGSSMVAATLCLDVHAGELRQLLLDGFLSQEDWSQASLARSATGMKSMGLPYEDDPSICRHLAQFLSRSAVACPDYILFNGGALKPKCFQEAILRALALWFDGNSPKVLPTASLDLAVSRGAAYYGKVRRGLGVRIRGGSPRAYYLGVDVQGQEEALTVLARGREEGFSYESSDDFTVLPNKVVSFHLYSSDQRLDDQEGSRHALNPEDFRRLPPIQTLLRCGSKASEPIAVRLQVQLSAMGTIEVWLQSKSSPHRWQLEFQLRSLSGSEDSMAQLAASRSDETLDDSIVAAAKQTVELCFSQDGSPAKVMKLLEASIGSPRNAWTPSILRAIADATLEQAQRRLCSAEHESRFWNLLGFALRPGFGYPLDDHRMAAFWRLWLMSVKATKSEDLQRQRWIALRRVAGGLSRGQQCQVGSQLMGLLLERKDAVIKQKDAGNPQDYAERLRALASLERLSIADKTRCGQALIKRICDRVTQPRDFWALARIGARQLLAGSLCDVVPPETCSRWIDDLLGVFAQYPEDLPFVLEQLARKTEHAEIDLAQKSIESILKHCMDLAPSLKQAQALTVHEQTALYGESLPIGLMLVS